MPVNTLRAILSRYLAFAYNKSFVEMCFLRWKPDENVALDFELVV